MKYKKGQTEIFAIFILIFVVIALTSIYIALSYKYEGKGVEGIKKSLGDYQNAIISAFEQRESTLLYVDQSARLSAFYALYNLGEEGGDNNSDCGAYLYYLWNEDGKECYPDYEARFKAHFNDSFMLYLNNSESGIDSKYNYDLKQEKKFRIYGIAEDNEDIWVSKNKVITSDYSSQATLVQSKIELIETYDDKIEKYSLENAIPAPLIKALIYHESAGKANAKSVADALGLMQIVPTAGNNFNHEFCVDKCGFSDDIDENEYFDPEMNICCGTAFLRSKMEQKSKIEWNCVGDQLDKGTHVQTTYDNPFEVGLRLYNGGACANWVDPDYVETIGHYYELYTGTPLVPDIYGKHSFKSDFTTRIDYNLSVYDTLVDFSKEIIHDCKDNVQNCLNEKIENFNFHNDITISDGCEDYQVYYDLIEGIKDCKNSAEKDCLCDINLDLSSETEDVHIIFKGKNISLEEPIYAHEDYKFGYDLSVISDKPSNTRKNKDYMNYYVDVEDDGVKDYVGIETGMFDSFGSFLTFGYDKKVDDLIIYKDTNGLLTFVKEKDNKKTCNLAKEKYTLCAKTPYDLTLIGDGFSVEPSKIKFSLNLPDRAPPSITGLNANDNLMENSSIVLNWNNFLRSVHDLDYYLIYCSKNSFGGSVGGKSYSHMVIPENEQDVQMAIKECNGEPIENNIQYYFAVTAVDRGGNENKQVTEMITTSVVNEPPTTNPYTRLNHYLIILHGQQFAYGLFKSDSSNILFPDNYINFLDDKTRGQNKVYINIYDSFESPKYSSWKLNEERGQYLIQTIKEIDEDVEIILCNKGQTNYFSDDVAILNRRFEFTQQKDNDCLEELRFDDYVNSYEEDEEFVETLIPHIQNLLDNFYSTETKTLDDVNKNVGYVFITDSDSRTLKVKDGILGTENYEEKGHFLLLPLTDNSEYQFFITNYHVIDYLISEDPIHFPLSDFYINKTLYENQEDVNKFVIFKQILSYSEEADIAFGLVKGVRKESFTVPQIYFTKKNPTTINILTGPNIPENSDYVKLAGTYSHTNTPWIYSDSHVFGGYSGSTAVNENGQVVGLVSGSIFYLNNDEQYTKIIDSESIRQLLEMYVDFNSLE